MTKTQDEIEADTMHSLSNQPCPDCAVGLRALDLVIEERDVAMEKVERLTQALADAQTVAQLRGDLLAERDARVGELLELIRLAHSNEFGDCDVCGHHVTSTPGWDAEDHDLGCGQRHLMEALRGREGK